MKSSKKQVTENKSRTVFAVKNVVLNFLYQVINTIANIIIPPLIISKFGSIINGLVSTIKQIINYIQVVGSGISESTIVSLYKPLSENDGKKVSAIYNASSKSFFKAGIIFSLCSLVLSFVYPWFLKENLQFVFVCLLIITMSISGASEFFAIGKYRTLLVADQKQYIVNFAQIFGLLSSAIVSIILIKSDVNIVVVQLFSSIFYVSRVLILRHYIVKRYRYLDKKVKPNNEAISRRKAAMIHQIASLIIFGSQTLLIANYCGLAEASVYSVYALIFTGINTMLSTFSSAMVAGMGNLLVSAKKEKVIEVYDIYEQGYYMLVSIVYLVTFILCLPFVKLYTSGATDANYIHFEFVILFSIMGLLNCIRTPGGTMINAKGHYDETKYRAIIEMVICLVGEILLIGKFGVKGVLIATIFAYLYRTIDVIIYSNKKILFRKIKKTLKSLSLNLIALVSLCFLSTRVEFSISSYFIWFIHALIIGLGSLIIFITINYIFNRDKIIELKKYIFYILRRKNDN